MMKKKKRYIGFICLAAVIFLAAGAIFFYYQTRSYLVLNGPECVEVNLCQVYQDPGASAKKGGEDVSSEIRIKSDLNVEEPGNYTITYSLDDLSVHRQIIVGEEMNPSLKLEGEDPLQILLGEDFEEPGFSAEDEKGKDLTDQVKVERPKFKKAGKSEISYTVKDSDGNCTTVKRQVEVLPNTEYETPGVPICMYHYVYDENDPPEDLYSRYGNYIEVHDLEEELAWLKEEGYYFPSWREVRDFVDGKMLLPEKSIVLCFDDGAKSFLEIGIPALEKYQVPATCFMITTGKGAKKVKDYPSKYVSYQSHSDNMHRSGGYIGHGGIFTVMPAEEALADLQMSIEKCGNEDAFAYPYGDYTQQCRDIVNQAGFLCAVTTEGGKARPGMDPLLLPRVRMNMGQTLTDFQYMVSPGQSERNSY